MTLGVFNARHSATYQVFYRSGKLIMLDVENKKDVRYADDEGVHYVEESPIDSEAFADFDAVAAHQFHYLLKEQVNYVRCFQVIEKSVLWKTFGIMPEWKVKDWCIVSIEGKRVILLSSYADELTADKQRKELERSQK